jgi:hypothetical protein
MGRWMDSLSPSAAMGGGMDADNETGMPSDNIVETANGDWYMFLHIGGNDPGMLKSTDDGTTWSVTDFDNDTVVAIAVWYDRWTDGAGDLIHVVWSGTSSDDVEYFNIDTASADAKSTPVIVFTGASAVGDEGHLSITKARGGNLYCSFMLDNGAESGFYRSTDAGANWTARTDINEGASDDSVNLQPGFAADTQDIMAIYWDASADEISRKVYDDSGDSWAETSIATSMADSHASRVLGLPDISAVCDYANSKIIFCAWSNTDIVNADLRCWTVDESTITETSTNIVLNSGGQQGSCALTLNTTNGNWYAFYCGAEAGSENYASNGTSKLYYKVSTDSGATWSSEAAWGNASAAVNSVYSTPRSPSANPPVLSLQSFGGVVRVRWVQPTARLQVGIA